MSKHVVSSAEATDRNGVVLHWEHVAVAVAELSEQYPEVQPAGHAKTISN